MANNISPFDASTGGVKGAAVNFLPSTSSVQWSSISVAGKGSNTPNTGSSAALGRKGGSSLGTTILSAALGFFTGGFGGMLSGLSGGISGGGGAKPSNFFESALAFFTGAKKDPTKP